ncbi:hypothetical protein PSN45_004548 [Yamadazyma tenuis]|uniref:MFS general substrate transporter n=1 Tax=Candida tenuis (strain ATCC 10573 / BCRC 21748 / CBS 615 / JCM 9827 / NBRC 10315 / NRRL Y-1498 / VKM Y-70) TaxID=590646 RepID=G3B5B2_CANTC|nr:MFS general substrate transporter [Yamadazyma tenuis ATCC 10573]EGV63173.1 MFS general substrate transporter [Yamadazyma tenuis ATCC 10573]WEJ97002.1 hypothetical protein PSN45_004548 [Yamadazyma tenuis]
MSVNQPLLEPDNEDFEDRFQEELEVPNKNYKIRNLLAFNFTGFFCIAFVIFLTSSQPFYINQILKVDYHEIGKVIGFLGVADELTCIVSSPLIGSLNDKLVQWNWVVGHTKFLVFTGFASIFVAFLLYGLVPYSGWWQLIFPRMFFAIGVTTCMSMVPVLLHQLIYSDFKMSSLLFWKETGAATSSNVNKNGRYAALIGLSTGLGAVFSVSCFLSLPVRLSAEFEISSRQALQLSFVILGILSILVGLLMLVSLYEPSTEDNKIHLTYIELIKTGFSRLRSSSSVQIACFGGWVARSTSVLIAVFIPLFVYNFYFKSGLCEDDGTPAKNNCYDGYTFAAILSGVAQTVSLLVSPFWGIVVDRIGKKKSLMLSSAIGLVGTWTLCILNISDPRNATTFFLMSLIGVSQIGTVITSMSIISAENDAVGSVSGVYNLFGGFGILILSQIGGSWSDSWVFAPFFLVGSFNLLLILAATFSK